MNGSTINIRRATAEDAALLASIGRQTFLDAYAADIDPDDIALHLDATFGPREQATELHDPSNTFLIAEKAAVAAGYAKLRASEPPGVISGPRPIEAERIYVLKERIGHGVGGMLLQACLSEAKDRGFETLWLGVWERNPRAIAFYEQWGFKNVGAHAFQLGNGTYTDVLMQRRVG